MPATRTIVNHSRKFFKYGRNVLLEKRDGQNARKLLRQAVLFYLVAGKDRKVSMVRLAVSLTKTRATLQTSRLHQPSLFLVTLALGDVILPQPFPLCSHSHPTSYSLLQCFLFELSFLCVCVNHKLMWLEMVSN